MVFGNLGHWPDRWHLNRVQSFKHKQELGLLFSSSSSSPSSSVCISLFERTDRPQVGQLEVSVVHFEDVSTGGCLDVDSEAHSLLESSAVSH